MSTESASLPPPQSYKGWSGIRRAFATPSAMTLLIPRRFGSGSEGAVRAHASLKRPRAFL